MGDLSENFSQKEFFSPDIGLARMQPAFINGLQAARDWARDYIRLLEDETSDIPFIITPGGGYRTGPFHRDIYIRRGVPEHKIPDSAHLRGWAADIAALNSKDMAIIHVSLIKEGFRRFGLYPEHKFIHVDGDPSLPSPRYWF